MSRNYGEREGPGWLKAEPFRPLAKSKFDAIASALKDLRAASGRKDGVAASKAADLLCELAMEAEGHFFYMRDRECDYMEGV
jgi:hypothetical protein